MGLNFGALIFTAVVAEIICDALVGLLFTAVVAEHIRDVSMGLLFAVSVAEYICDALLGPFPANCPAPMVSVVSPPAVWVG